MRNRVKYLNYRIVYCLNLLNVFVLLFPSSPFPSKNVLRINGKRRARSNQPYLRILHTLNIFYAIYIYIPRHTWRAQDRCAKSQWQVRGSYSPNTITRVILTVLTLALGISPRDDTLLVSLVGPWRNAPPCDHIVATITA